MSQQSFANWGQTDPATGMPGQLSMGPAPTFRDAKDRQLQAFGESNLVNYPDGLLGTITDRRQDKLGTTRSNTRSYAKGVHKGERVNPGDYIWPDEFNPMTGLEYEAAGLKYACNGAAPVVLTNDGKAGPRGIPANNFERPTYEIVNEQRRSMLKTMVPQWR